MQKAAGFDWNSNESAQKNNGQQQERISRHSVPLNCQILNQLKEGKIGFQSAQNQPYEWDNPFEIAIITARYVISENPNAQSKIEGTLSDATGSINVASYKPKDSDEFPEYLQNFMNENPSNRPIYVRAVLRVRKQGPVVLVSFTIVRDFNEITRHNLDIALRYMYRTKGSEVLQGAGPSAKKDAASSKKAPPKFVVSPNLDPTNQVLSYFKQITEKLGNNTQVPFGDLIEFFSDRLNQVQIKNAVKELQADYKIMNIPPTDFYFLLN